ncbi:MAG: T9SS type A sorting domain-containing protein [Bacteroidota bacterium]
MKTFIIENNRNNFNSFARQTTSTLHSLAFLLTLGLCFIAPQLAAQATRFVPLSELSHAISYPSGTFDTGDEVTITINVGTLSSPVDSVVEMELKLTYTADAADPETDQIDLGNSWVGAATTLTNTSTVNAGTRVLHINASRSDGTFTSGYGEVAQVTLVCDADNLSAQDLVASLDGGFGVIDNVDMKIVSATDPTPGKTLRCYPNPVSEQLYLEGLQPGETFRIYDLGSNIVRQGQADPAGYQTVNLAQLQAGMYILQSEHGYRQKLLVR